MLPAEILAPYACKDGDATFQLYGKFKPLWIKVRNSQTIYKNTKTCNDCS